MISLRVKCWDKGIKWISGQSPGRFHKRISGIFSQGSKGRPLAGNLFFLFSDTTWSQNALIRKSNMVPPEPKSERLHICKMNNPDKKFASEKKTLQIFHNIKTRTWRTKCISLHKIEGFVAGKWNPRSITCFCSSSHGANMCMMSIKPLKRNTPMWT